MNIQNIDINLIARAAETLGYSFTGEERKLLNGTHELYVKDEENE